MSVCPSRNALASDQLMREALNYCDGKPTFIIDNAPWLKQSWRSWAYHIMRGPFGDRSLIESVYSSFKLKYSSTI